ncbi:MAG: hypothetical protein KA807_10115 [Prolixibacteraceae bacterium]|nr:hypothetical protein [Prolixibacteraceae bacterium]
MNSPVILSNMKTMIKTCISLFIILSLAGCDKNDSFHDLVSGKYIFIFNEVNDTICANSYDKIGLLIKSISHDDAYSPGENAELNYTYNSNNLLVKKTGYIPGIMYISSYQGAMGKEVKLIYEYDENDRLSKITTFFHYPDFPEIDYTSIQTFEYFDDKVIEYNGNTPEEITLRTEYLLNDKGNIQTKLYYYKSEADSFILNTKEEYTYDNYKTPFQAEPTPKSKNNVLTNKITYYQSDEQGIYYQSYTSDFSNEYEYNINGYPEKMIITYPNWNKETRIYKY